MNALTLAVFLLTEAMYIAFIFVIIRSGITDAIKKSFFYFLITFSLWSASNYISNLTFLPIDLLLVLNRALFLISVFGLIALLVFITATTNQKNGKLTNILLGILVPVAALISFSPWVVTHVFVDQTAVVGVEFGPLSIVYFAIVTYLIVLIFHRLIRSVHQKSARDRSKARLLLVTIGLAITTIVLTNVILPVVFEIFTLTMIGLFAGMFIIVGVAYGIVRHGMFDVKYAAVRSVTYALVLLTLMILYFVFAIILSNTFGFVFGDSRQAFNGMLISIVLVLVFQPIKQYLDKVTSHIFYKNDYTSENFFASLNRIIVSTTNLSDLLSQISYYISNTIKSEYVEFLVTTPNKEFFTEGSSGRKKIPIQDIEFLNEYFTTEKNIVQRSMIVQNLNLKRLLISHGIEILVPLFQAQDLIGIICLGDHRTSAYTRRDLRVLHTASDEIGIAIQNALSIHEVRELNAHLEQRVDAATKELRRSNAQLQKLDESKDDFLSMASHQLRTPLTSIKGYISMLMEGDIGKVSPEQKKVLNEAFISSERMVRLISDFLNVSRLQTGKFVIDKHPVNLALLVQQEIDSLVPNAQAREMKFEYKAPKNIPELELDENKIEQVVMNFCDNAIYYSKEKSKIIVSLKKTANWVEFTVKDSGIGVPIEDQPHLFNKFFRAPNAKRARPDGTGVGLFLAKKVIDAHDGMIIFESIEGKGSTFGFKLPLPSKK